MKTIDEMIDLVEDYFTLNSITVDMSRREIRNMLYYCLDEDQWNIWPSSLPIRLEGPMDGHFVVKED